MVAFVYISFEKAFTYMVWLIHDFESGKGSQVVEGIYFFFLSKVLGPRHL